MTTSFTPLGHPDTWPEENRDHFYANVGINPDPLRVTDEEWADFEAFSYNVLRMMGQTSYFVSTPGMPT